VGQVGVGREQVGVQPPAEALAFLVEPVEDDEGGPVQGLAAGRRQGRIVAGTEVGGGVEGGFVGDEQGLVYLGRAIA
jgi:hypothetical protein